MKNPVKTGKEEIKKDLVADVEAFKTEFESVLRAEEMLTEMFNNSEIDTAKCEEESQKDLVTKILSNQKLIKSCPRWSNWEMGECSETCGQGYIYGSRKCLDGNNQQIDVGICQNEYKSDSNFERSTFCHNRPCG